MTQLLSGKALGFGLSKTIITYMFLVVFAGWSIPASAVCPSYNLATGLFTTVESFHIGPEGAFEARIKPSDVTRYEILHSGSVVATLLRGTYDDAFSWNLFPGNDFLAVQLVRISGGFTDYKVDVWDVSNPGTPVNVSPSTGPLSGSSSPQLHVDPSTDGKAYHLWIGESGNQSKSHVVYRSDSGASLCGGLPTSSSGQRLAEHAGGNIRIFLGPPSGTTLGTCSLPQGSLNVLEGCQVFPEVVIGGLGSATSTRTYTLRNDGDDCEIVSAIGNVAPFSVFSTSSPFPVSLDVGDSMTAVVQFAPSSTGSTGEVHLPVTRNPANGDDHLCAEGNARDPVASLGFVTTGLSFGSHPVGSSASGALTITNDGELPVTIDVPGPPAGSAFNWTPVPAGTILAPTANRIVNVSFNPSTEGPFSGTLVVNSSLPTSPDSFLLSGSGCVANGVLSYPLVPFPLFGDVEVGYRGVRFVIVANTGDGEATLRARIDDTSTGFGLADASGSITSSEVQRTWTIQPVTRCGVGSTGSGQQLVAVNFWATGAPGPRTATLTLEHMSGGSVVSSQTYSLVAEVVPAITLDLGIAIDCSGSMGDPVCARQKSQAAMDAGQLLVQLMRSDVDDRVSTVRFNHNPEVLQPIVAVSDSMAPTKSTIASGLNATNLSPSGSTSIAGGAMVALSELETPRATVPPSLRKSVVILTDGKDNTAYADPDTGQWYSVMGGRSREPGGGFWFDLNWVDTDPLPWPADVKGYAVGIGADEDIDRGQLAALSTGTGGFYQVVTCLDGDNYFQLEKYFLQIFMDAVDLASVEDPVFIINPGETHRFEFDLLRGDVGGLVTIFDRAGVRLPVRVISPSGEELNSATIPPGFLIRNGIAPTARFLEFKVPQTEPDRYAGRWIIEILHSGFTGPDVTTHVPTHSKEPVMYGIAIGAGSNFRMQPYVTPGHVSVGDVIRVSAVLSEAGWPVIGGTVMVEAVAPSGATQTLRLYNDGLHNDGDRNDGEYAATYDQTSEGGSYVFTYTAEALSRDDETVRRESTLGKYVEGRIPVDPQPKEGDDICKVLKCWLPIILVVLVLLILIVLIANRRR